VRDTLCRCSGARKQGEAGAATRAGPAAGHVERARRCSMRGDGDVQMRKLHVDISRNHDSEHRGGKNVLLTADTPHPAARGAPPPLTHCYIQCGVLAALPCCGVEQAAGKVAHCQVLGHASVVQDACVFLATLSLGVARHCGARAPLRGVTPGHCDRLAVAGVLSWR